MNYLRLLKQQQCCRFLWSFNQILRHIYSVGGTQFYSSQPAADGAEVGGRTGGVVTPCNFAPFIMKRCWRFSTVVLVLGLLRLIRLQFVPRLCYNVPMPPATVVLTLL